jgi:hypothetical protein
MTKFFLSSLLLVGLVIGCAKTPDPTLNKKLNSIQVLQRIDELENLVFDLYATKEIDKDHAVLYVKFCVSSAKVIKAQPVNWQLLVKTSWTELRKQLPFTESKLVVVIGSLDVLIGLL